MLSLLKQVFAQRKTQADEIFDEYHDLLVRLASGEEVDIEEVTAKTVDAGKTEEQCSRDLQLLETRLAKIKERERLLAIKEAVPALQQKFNALKAELDAVVARIQPELNAIGLELYDASFSVPNLIQINDFLNTHCLNRLLVEREREVSSDRVELMTKRKTLYDDLQIGERTRSSGGFVGRPRCVGTRDLLVQLFQRLACAALGSAQCGRVGLVPALLLSIGTDRFGMIHLPTIRQ